MELFSLEDAYVPLTPKQISAMENEDYWTLNQDLMSLHALSLALGIIYEEEEDELSEDENPDYTKTVSGENASSFHQLNVDNELEEQSFESNLSTFSMTDDIEGENCVGVACDPSVISWITEKNNQ
ncbi:uncharacterized protein LOC111633294 [Centruroides sculpturatus]|uniref:uncharacterized protein LOC111633294 n=1 Tax=Centruroides sculpturatus TaxID=218467 RepID=UPI000C6CC062|nr:uncharacterized protein LOC111633294 [Centruroides sculpturatus]